MFVNSGMDNATAVSMLGILKRVVQSRYKHAVCVNCITVDHVSRSDAVAGKCSMCMTLVPVFRRRQQPFWHFPSDHYTKKHLFLES